MLVEELHGLLAEDIKEIKEGVKHINGRLRETEIEQAKLQQNVSWHRRILQAVGAALSAMGVETGLTYWP